MHTPPGGTTPEPGLRLESTQIGLVGQRYEMRVVAGEEVGPCDASFQAEVTPRQFTAALKGGASIEVEGAIEVQLSGGRGAGFELRLESRNTPRRRTSSVDTKVTVSRSMDAKLGVGVKFATTEAGFTVAGSEISLGKVDPDVRGSIQLMLRDRHEFETPIDLRKGAGIGQLFLGLLAASATPGLASPAGPMLAGVGLNELAERVAGLDEYRRSFGGGVGVRIGAGASFSSTEIPLGLGTDRSLQFKVSGEIEAAAIGAIDVITPPVGSVTVEPSLEYRAAVDLAASFGLVAEQESQEMPGEETADFNKSVEFLARLFQVEGTANFAGTVRFAASLDITSPTQPVLKGITISVHAPEAVQASMPSDSQSRKEATARFAG